LDLVINLRILLTDFQIYNQYYEALRHTVILGRPIKLNCFANEEDKERSLYVDDAEIYNLKPRYTWAKRENAKITGRYQSPQENIDQLDPDGRLIIDDMNGKMV